jgi:hypothetical protein
LILKKAKELDRIAAETDKGANADPEVRMNEQGDSQEGNIGDIERRDEEMEFE